MAKFTKQEMTEIKNQGNELLKLILNKTGVSYNSLIEHAKREFILNNLDLVSVSERKQFSKLVF